MSRIPTQSSAQPDSVAGTALRRESERAQSSDSGSRFSAALGEALEGQSAQSNQVAPYRSPFAPSTAAAPAPAESVAPATGLVTASGAPNIVLNSTPSDAQPDYSGPAAENPYFGVLRPDNVVGFEKWFQPIQVAQPEDLGSYTWPPNFSATEEGAQEALRLVQQYVPEAKIQPFYYSGQVGQTRSHAIALPNGDWLNAGLLLDSYYHQGQGVNAWSDGMLRSQLAGRGLDADAGRPV